MHDIFVALLYLVISLTLFIIAIFLSVVIFVSLRELARYIKNKTGV